VKEGNLSYPDSFLVIWCMPTSGNITLDGYQLYPLSEGSLNWACKLQEVTRKKAFSQEVRLLACS